jgi:GntR family transcriptional repressor for pyruvate dehydrogenase complex
MASRPKNLLASPFASTPANAFQPGVGDEPRQRRSDLVYGQLIEQIIAGDLPENARLPTEHELAKGFGVSRSVVREALMRLSADGVVTARQGSGTYVQRRPSDRVMAFARPSDLPALLRAFEMRLALEGAAARLAAVRRNEAQLAAMQACHSAFATQAAEGQPTPQADFAFHRAVIEATGNPYFLAAIEATGDAVLSQMDVALKVTREMSRERANAVVAEHARVLDSIRSGDGEGAEIAMRFHIDQARKRLVDRSRQG